MADTVYGYGMYVGGVNVADAKAELKIDSITTANLKPLYFPKG